MTGLLSVCQSVLMTPTAFVKVSPGKYRVEITLRSGATRPLFVQSTSVLNGSARGGAYKTRWFASNKWMYLRVGGDTRQEAYDKAVALLTARGFLAVTEEENA